MYMWRYALYYYETMCANIELAREMGETIKDDAPMALKRCLENGILWWACYLKQPHQAANLACCAKEFWG